MDQNKNFSNEPGKTTGNNPTSTGTTPSRANNPTPSATGSSISGSSTSGSSISGSSAPSTYSTADRAGAQVASATQRARDTAQTAYEQTRQVMSDAYGKTSEALSNSYDQAMVYGRENPGKLTLIAFGAGIGIGLLLATGFGGRSRTSRIAEPIVGALSQVAMEFFK